MLTISSGHSASYLTGAVGSGRENYYTGAVTEGEPPGRWYGKGAAKFGLAGLVDHQDMEALYSKLVDPGDEDFRNPDRWDQAAILGARPPRYTETAEDRLAKLLEAEPNASPERVDALKIQASKGGRSAVMFHDATFSVQKSVSVLHTSFARMEAQAETPEERAAWAEHRTAVEEAIWAGNRAALDYLEDRAGYSRVGHHGGQAGRWVDAHNFTVASFFQHTNRDEGPQLHIHNAILNRVECPDGTYRTIDGQALYAERGAAASIAERTMEEHLSKVLGVRFATRTDGKAREVVGISSEVLDLFSTRRRAITGKAEELCRNFEKKYGREPNLLERSYLSQQATLATRAAKSHHAETTDARLDRFDREIRDLVASGLEGVARSVLGRAGYTPAQEFSPTGIMEAALAEVQAGRSSWTRSDLMRTVTANLPDSLGGLDGRQVRGLIEGIADRMLAVLDPDPGTPDGGQRGGETTLAGAVSLTHRVAAVVPEELRLADGRSAYAKPGSQKFATRDQLAAERALREAAVERGAVRVDVVAAAGFVERLEAELAVAGRTLGPDQRAAVLGVLTSGARVEALVGPAGAGKSFALGAINDGWRELVGGKLIGLATSQIATEVLAGEGLEAMNIARFLAAHEAGKLSLGHKDLVMVDESGMTNTAQMDEVRRIVTAVGAKMIATGDHRQLAAVGAGGAFKLISGSAVTYELTEVRRFRDAEGNTRRWEAEASLQVREGKTEGLLPYLAHGRLVDGGTFEGAAQKAVRAYLGDTLAGKRSLLIVDTNDSAATISGQVRAELVRLGRVEGHGVRLGRDGNFAGIGDRVQARLNARTLAGYRGNIRGPINRETYQVVDVFDDGGLTVADDAGNQINLPASYVEQHLALGYAVTVHGAQGQTVETGHQIITPNTSAGAMYAGITRGWENNTAYVETISVTPDARPGEAHDVQRRPAVGVLADILETAQTESAALTQLEESAALARNVGTVVDLFADAVQLAQAGRVEVMLDQLAAAGTLTEDQRAAIAADPSMPVLGRLLRTVELAGHDPEAVCREAIESRPLDDARNLAHITHHRISKSLAGQLAPTGETFGDRVPPVGGVWEERLRQLADIADERRRELGVEVAEIRPRWAVEHLGPVPDGVLERAEWEHKAGIVAAERERSGEADEALAIGKAPTLGEHEARASWYAAWSALGRPEADREEAEMTDGQLRLRVRALDREEAWAPSYVADRLGDTSQRLAEVQASAEIAKASEDIERAAELKAEADRLDADREALEKIHEARGEWYAETLATRTTADRAREELAQRGRDVGAEEDRVTAEEWLAEKAKADQIEDQAREIREEDLADAEREKTAIRLAREEAERVDAATQEEQRLAAEEAERWKAEKLAAEKKQAAEGEKTPTVVKIAAAVIIAQQALRDIDDRRDLEARRMEDEDRARHWADTQRTRAHRTAGHESMHL